MLHKILYYLILLTLIFTGCKSPQYLTTPQDFNYNVKGLYFECEISGYKSVLGEIIEVSPEYIKILPFESESSLLKIEKDRVVKGDILVALTSNNPKKIQTWSALVNFAPLGHGYFAVFTVPINLAATIPMSHTASKGAYRINYPDGIQWIELAKFARFPQGIPNHIKEKDIQ